MRKRHLPISSNHNIAFVVLVTVMTITVGDRLTSTSSPSDQDEHSRTVWHPVNHHDRHDEEWQRRVDQSSSDTFTGFHALKANPMLTVPEKEVGEHPNNNSGPGSTTLQPNHDDGEGIVTLESPASIFDDRISNGAGEAPFRIPPPKIPQALQYERSGVAVSEHKGPYHPALHSIHYTTNHSEEERKDMLATRPKEIARESNNGRASGRPKEADRYISRNGIDQDRPEVMDSGKPPEGVLPSTVRGQMNKSDRSSRHRDAVSGMNGTMEEHRAGAEALRDTKGSGTTLGKEAWHTNKHPRKALVRGRIRKAHVRSSSVRGDTVPRKYHPHRHHKISPKTAYPRIPIAPPGYRHYSRPNEAGSSNSTLSEELSSLLSLWKGESPSELDLLDRKDSDWKTMGLSQTSRTKGWLSAVGDRYTAAVNHQVEGNIMLAKLLIFLSVNSNGGPNDIITAPSEPDLGDLPNHDPLFLCNHVCWQRHPKGITETDIKGSASVVTRCEVSPMADILFRRTKPSLLRSLTRVCDEECIAMTAEDNSPISACVAVPCSERCRVEGTRCSATLEYDWYAHGFCSSKCSPTENRACEAKPSSSPLLPQPSHSTSTYDLKCLWTRACDGCLKQEEPTTLVGKGTLVTAFEMQCMNFDGECRPLGGDGACASTTTSASGEFFPCAAPYFEEAFPYGPYYTTVNGKPYKEVRNIGVDWNNFTVAVEAVLHNHRGATPECFKARFLVVDSSREKKYRLEDRQWRSAICAEHWDDRTLPWEIDDRVVRGDFDGHIEDMFLFESDQNPSRPASVRVVGKVPLMRAAQDMDNVVHLTPDFNDYQVLLCLGPRSGYMSPLGDAALKVLGPWRLKLTNDLLETNVGIQRGKEEGIATEIPSPGMHTHGVLVP